MTENTTQAAEGLSHLTAELDTGIAMNLMLGDCLERMKEIPDGSVDLTVTSPPYDNLRTYNGNNALWGEHVWKSVIQDLFRVTKQGGVVVCREGCRTDRCRCGYQCRDSGHRGLGVGGR